jgi:hypothetical protein
MVPICAGTIAGATGWAISTAAGKNFVSGVLGGACTTIVFLALTFLLNRKLLLETVEVVAGAVREGLRRRAGQVESAPSLAA